MASIIQITRSQKATVYQAADLQIRTASALLHDGQWQTRRYSGPEDYEAVPAATRELAEHAALAHSLRIAR